MVAFLGICCILFAFVNAEINKLGRGFGDNIDWMTYTEGKQKSAEQNKNMMIIFHNPWCSACSALKPIFAGSDEIQKLSKSFIMVNIESYDVRSWSESPSDHYSVHTSQFWRRVTHPALHLLLSGALLLIATSNEELGGAPPYNPDGAYIPRIFFIDSSGELLEDIYNEEGNANYKYYHSKAETVVQSMEKALMHSSNQKIADEL